MNMMSKNVDPRANANQTTMATSSTMNNQANGIRERRTHSIAGYAT